MSTDLQLDRIVDVTARFFFYVGVAVTLLWIARAQITTMDTAFPGAVRSAFVGTAALVLSTAILAFYLLYLGIKSWNGGLSEE